MSGFMANLTADPANLFDMLFNGLIIIALGGLWLMWARSQKRQKNVEDILSATSVQLEEATRHLESALNEISRLQQRAHSSQVSDTRPDSIPLLTANTYSPSRARTAPQPAQQAGTNSQERLDQHPATRSPAAHTEPALPPSPAVETAAPSDVQQIIALHAAGKSADDIATLLKLPQARIHLLLRLHEHSPAVENR